MKHRTLIGLTGKKRSGKSTVAEYMAKWGWNEGHKPELRGFADSLKLSFARTFLPETTMEDALDLADRFKEHGSITLVEDEEFAIYISGREALQNYGTESHRDIFGANFWVDYLLPLARYNGFPGWGSDTDLHIITDVRFTNEAERIGELGGRVYEVVRPSLKDDGDTHATEQPLPEELIHGTFYNDSTLINLMHKVYGEMHNIRVPV